MKSVGKKLPSPQIVEESDEQADTSLGENSTLETLKQESSLSTCAHSIDEDGDVAVVEEVRLEDPKVRPWVLVFWVWLSELSCVCLQQDSSYSFCICLWDCFLVCFLTYFYFKAHLYSVNVVGK